MLLGDANALMAEQDGDALDRHTREQQFHRKRVTEPMRNSVPISLRDLRQIEYRSELSLPVLNGGFQLALAGPEVEFRCDAGRNLKRLRNRIRQHGVDGRACLGRVEEKFVAFEPVGAESYRVADSHSAVAQ